MIGARPALGERALTFEERLRAQDEVTASLFRPDRRLPVVAALAASAIAHVALALLPLRGTSAPSPPLAPPPSGPEVRGAPHGIVPPLPGWPRAAAAAPAPPQSRLPVADAADVLVEPPLRWPDPVVEGEPDLRPEPLPTEAEVLLGFPEPPPAGPQTEMGEVTDPQLLPESRVRPVYPDRARLLRIPGVAVLSIEVRPDGTVGGVVPVRCNPPNLGFCEAAADAVRQWRYRPGLQAGRPVQVTVSVKVDFNP